MSTEATDPPLPPRLLPTLYFGFAHACLALAFAVVAYDPRGVAGFFYHSRMLGVVHLVTLGWITTSILGALYVVGPIALRARVRAGWLDYAGALLVAIGTVGMVAHFWIEEYGGMAWSGGTVGVGIIIVGARIAGPLLRARISPAIRLHIALAFANLTVAAVVGVLLGINKNHPILPGFVLHNVFAHAQLAALGWAAMMVVGIGYRLLPMVLPAQMPHGSGLWASAILLQSGITGVFVTLLLGVGRTWIFASLVVAGFAAFFREVNWMVHHRRPKPPANLSPDPAVLHAAAALSSLAIACVLGLWLAAAAPSTGMLRIATAYGVLGLVGFLAQMIVVMERRLLPLFAWYCASADDGGRRAIVSPQEMPWRVGQEIVFVLWLAGMPALAGGLAFDAVPFVSAGAWSLLAASLLESIQTVTILRHAYAKPSRSVEPGRIISSSEGRSGLSTNGVEPSAPLLPGSSACRACPTYRRDA
jgi:hypothetical protein